MSDSAEFTRLYLEAASNDAGGAAEPSRETTAPLVCISGAAPPSGEDENDTFRIKRDCLNFTWSEYILRCFRVLAVTFFHISEEEAFTGPEQYSCLHRSGHTYSLGMASLVVRLQEILS